MRYVLLIALLVMQGCHMNTSALPPLPAWQSPQGHQDERLGVILDLNTGRALTPERLLQRIASAPRIVVGEKHDNPDHHALELWLLQALASRRAQGSVLLEMLEPDQQSKVTAYQLALRSGQPVGNAAAALDWRQGWDWSLYGPLVTWQLEQPAPLLAANLDREEIKKLFETPVPLNGERSTHEGAKRVLLQQIRDSHCGLLPDARMAPMLHVQQHRDRRMAERLNAAPVPSLLIAGGYHARKDVGVPLHLQDMGSSALVILLAETGQDVDASVADYVWFTPAMPEQDYCAQMRRQFDR